MDALLNHSAFGNASWLELIWTLIAAFGIVFSIYNSKQSWGDLKSLKQRGIGNGRRIIANLGFKMELVRGIIQGIFIAIGVVAMTFPAPPDFGPQPLHLLLYRHLFTYGLVVSAALLSLKSYWNWSARRQLIEQYSLETDETTTVAEQKEDS